MILILVLQLLILFLTNFLVCGIDSLGDHGIRLVQLLLLLLLVPLLLLNELLLFVEVDLWLMLPHLLLLLLSRVIHNVHQVAFLVFD